MFDVCTLEKFLSFIQLSIALNFACVLLDSKSPIERLFQSAAEFTKNCLESYRSEYKIRMVGCIQYVREYVKDNPEDTNASLVLKKLITLHLKTDGRLENALLRAKSPICFPFACLLLGVYGTITLLTVPILNMSNLDWLVNFFVAFSGFTVAILVILFLFEIIGYIFKFSKISSKHLVWGTYLILLVMAVSIRLSFSSEICEQFENYRTVAYNFAIISGYISFIICFLWFTFDRIFSFFVIETVRCRKCIFENIYNEFQNSRSKIEENKSSFGDYWL